MQVYTGHLFYFSRENIHVDGGMLSINISDILSTNISYTREYDMAIRGINAGTPQVQLNEIHFDIYSIKKTASDYKIWRVISSFVFFSTLFLQEIC